jgi:hypothetical protein
MAKTWKMALFATLLLSAPGFWDAALADCACVNRDGVRHDLGEVACLRVDGRSYLAECEMNLNVTSWKKIADDCPEARIVPQQSLWQRSTSL